MRAWEGPQGVRVGMGSGAGRAAARRARSTRPPASAEFYKQHHDQQSGHWTPQGVRIYTFFVYLSDVEEGGGTRFTKLGLTVKPKLGRGILWPSVQDETLRISDPRTEHEALPVERGIKYAANLWQHLYDFKTPSRAGLCVFLGKNSNHA